MGEQTGIAWTDSTINVWHGCDKVSAGCKHCYAEVSTPVRVKRAQGLEVWGANAARSETKGWEANLRGWNRSATTQNDDPWRVFGQSLSDTFEEYSGGRVALADGILADTLDPLRARFFAAIEAAPALTFQLLTKRPQHVLSMVPPSWLKAWPEHVWIGATAESAETLAERLPHLIPLMDLAPVVFLSVEPQVDAVDATEYLRAIGRSRAQGWVIQGGESGSKARPFDLAWARSLRDQCRAAGVAYFYKQEGAKGFEGIAGENHRREWTNRRDSHGGDETEWPMDLRGCRAFPR